jgi:hypothetical protein
MKVLPILHDRMSMLQEVKAVFAEISELEAAVGAAFDPGARWRDQNEGQFYSHRLPIIKVIQQRRASGKASSMWEAVAQQ